MASDSRRQLPVLIGLVLALVAGGIVAYEALSEQTRQVVQTGEQITGDVEQAVEQLRDLIQANIR